ncbi:MAG: RNA 2',3'-cyclic phosphodiesterase [Candidatus Zixiibacteriota bacterium]
MYRLFVAVDLPEDVKQHLGAISCGVPGARWMEPAQLHLTIRFIGEVDGGVFRDILDSLREVQAHAFDLTLKGVGFFPPRGVPETIWVGVEKSEPLKLLRSRVEAALARAGVDRDSRKFAPHVAIARLKEPHVGRVAGYLTEYGLFRVEPFQVAAFTLYSSSLSSSGAIHQVEEEYPLNGKRN